MADLFKKIAKVVLIGGGSVLSLFAPAIGAPLIVAGTAINTSLGKTPDKVSAYGTNINTAIKTAGAMQSSTAQPGLTMGFNSIVAFIQQNLMVILLSIAGIFILPKLLKNRRRR